MKKLDEAIQSAPCINRYEIGIDVDFNFFQYIDIFLKPSVLHSYTKTGPDKTEHLTWFECTIGCKISGHEVFNVSNNP